MAFSGPTWCEPSLRPFSSTSIIKEAGSTSHFVAVITPLIPLMLFASPARRFFLWFVHAANPMQTATARATRIRNQGTRSGAGFLRPSDPEREEGFEPAPMAERDDTARQTRSGSTAWPALRSET